MPQYDAQELRRRMPVCFTIGELYKLADKLQVMQSPSWSNNPQEAARDIVRHFEQSGVLAFLVDALREAKPLVEWPEPLPPKEPPPPAAAPPPGASTLLAAPAEQALEFADTAIDTPGDRPTPLATMSAGEILASLSRGAPDPDQQAAPAAAPAPAAPSGGFAPMVMPKPGEAFPAPPSSSAAPKPPLAATIADAPPSSVSAASASSPARTAGPAWPGTVSPAGAAAPAKKSLDPKILLGAGAAVLVLAVVLAFFIGRASSSGSGTASGAGSTSASGAASASASASAAPTSDQAEVAQHVVDALGSSLERVAKACQIEANELRGHSLFEVAYERCGQVPESVVHVRPPRHGGDPGSGANVPPPTGKQGRPGGGNKLQRVDVGPGAPSTGGSACLSSCAKSHRACTAKCGAEPKQSSLYDAYQACLSGCLKASAQCKQGCN
jgi:hypothetical protein